MSELFLKLLNMSITAGWLVIAVVVLRLVLKKAPKWVNCVLWALVAVRLICPFSFESDISLVPEQVGSGELVSEWADDYVDDVWTIPDTSIYYDAAVFNGREPIYAGDGHYYVVAKYDQLGEPATVKDTVVPVLTAIWLAGVAVLLLHALISYLRLRRRVSAAMHAGDKVWLCDAVESPFILGIFRPRIYLPSCISEGDVQHVLAHERAHLQRRDHWWKPIGYVLLSVYWFNPLIWVAYILLCRDIELACDEKVIKRPDTDRKAYSEALLACSVKRSSIAACPLAFGEVGVKGRIKSVLNYKKPAFWIILVALVACAAAAVCFLTDPVEPTVDTVAYQQGYGITEMTTGINMEIKVPLDVLSDSAYSERGQSFGEDEVIVYQTNNTSLYLENASYRNGETEYLFLTFAFAYDISDEGVIRTMFIPNIEDGASTITTLSLYHRSKEVSDSKTTYMDALYFRGETAGVSFTVGVKTDVIKEASDYISFQLANLTDITYEKGKANHEDDIVVKNASSENSETSVSPNGVDEPISGTVDSGVVNTEVDYAVLNGDADFSNQLLEIKEDLMTYQERLDWVKSGEVYTVKMPGGGESPVVSLKQWQEGNGCLAYVWTYYGSPHPGLCFLTIRFADGTQARLPLPNEQTNRTAKPTSMEFKNGKFVYHVQLDSEWPEDEGIPQKMYHYELDLIKKTLSLSLEKTKGTAKPTEVDVSDPEPEDKIGYLEEEIADRSVVGAMLAAVEALMTEQLPATICKTDEAGHIHPVFGKLNAWASINGRQSCSGILNHTYQVVDSIETSNTLITLEFAVNGVDWGLTFYDGTDTLSVYTGGAEYLLRATPKQEDVFLSPLGSLIRRWYDEAEYMALDGYDGKTIVIPNTGQSYLEAAKAWCEAYESIHLIASSGSKECYSYVSCRVEPAEPATDLRREQGEIDENTYAFYAYTAFVPENEQALNWSMAGNTGAYEGNDPNVPKEAYEYTRCGYITREEDGWHGTIVGTGW